ncbi:MAG: hypothetical protein RRY40_03360, partial [Oscillospiraceae bacterium]
MANRMAKNNGGEGVVRRHRPLKTVFRALLILMMILIIAGCIVASIMTVYVINTLDSGDSIVLDEAKLGFSTIIYATNEKTGEYEEIQRVQTNENRIWVDYDKIPQHVANA